MLQIIVFIADELEQKLFHPSLLICINITELNIRMA
jgi:hypothetical protein